MFDVETAGTCRRSDERGPRLGTLDVMDLFVDDDAFIRGPATLVYRRLSDPGTYSDWWPGFRMLSAAPVGARWDTEAEAEGGVPHGGLTGRPVEPGETRFSFELRPRRTTRLRLEARPYRFREDSGLQLALDGSLTGTVEWWLQRAWGGTVVHHIARLTIPGRRRAASAAAYRRAIRLASWGLKDAVQSEVRERIGLDP